MLNSDKLNSLGLEDIRTLNIQRWRQLRQVDKKSVVAQQIQECWVPFRKKYGEIKYMFQHPVGHRTRYHIICLKCLQSKYFVYTKWSTYLEDSLFIAESDSDSDSEADSPPNPFGFLELPEDSQASVSEAASVSECSTEPSSPNKSSDITS